MPLSMSSIHHTAKCCILCKMHAKRLTLCEISKQQMACVIEVFKPAFRNGNEKVPKILVCPIMSYIFIGTQGVRLQLFPLSHILRIALIMLIDTSILYHFQTSHNVLSICTSCYVCHAPVVSLG